MVIEAAERMPDANWADPDDHRYTPVRLVYHLLMAAERYTYTGDPEEYLKAPRQFSKDWVQAPVSELISRGAALAELRDMRSRTEAWLNASNSSLTASPPKWPWTGKTLLGQALYFLRHTQHHQAELNRVLRQLGLQPVKWK